MKARAGSGWRAPRTRPSESSITGVPLAGKVKASGEPRFCCQSMSVSSQTVINPRGG